MCACRECYHYRGRVLFKGTEIISKAIRFSRDGVNKGNIIWLGFLEMWFTLINYFIYFILNNI